MSKVKVFVSVSVASRVQCGVLPFSPYAWQQTDIRNPQKHFSSILQGPEGPEK